MSRTEDKMNKLIKKNLVSILDGNLLAIDPGSNSLGYARFEGGELTISGEIKGIKGADAHIRLQQIAEQLVELEAPDVLVIELVRKNTVLIWSVGATLACVKCPVMIEVPIKVWHALREDDYEKTDELDAQLIGQAVINRARSIKQWTS